MNLPNSPRVTVDQGWNFVWKEPGCQKHIDLFFFGEHGHTSEQANKKVFSWKETKYHEIDWNKMIYQKIQAETIHYHHFLEHCWHLLTKQLVKQWSISFALLWLEAIIT